MVPGNICYINSPLYANTLQRVYMQPFDATMDSRVAHIECSLAFAAAFALLCNCVDDAVTTCAWHAKNSSSPHLHFQAPVNRDSDTEVNSVACHLSIRAVTMHAVPYSHKRFPLMAFEACTTVANFGSSPQQPQVCHVRLLRVRSNKKQTGTPKCGALVCPSTPASPQASASSTLSLP